MSDHVEILIARYQAAYAVFEAECTATDCVLIGREATPEEWAQYDAAHQAKESALHALCAHAPESAEAASKRAAYLLEHRKRNDIGDEAVDALLRSMVIPAAA